MKGKMRLSLPVLGVATLIAAGLLLALLTLDPWAEDAAEDAAASPAEYGICNVFFVGIPEGVVVGPVPKFNEETGNTDLYIMAWIPYGTGAERNGSSRIVWDALTGDKVFEAFRTPAEKAKLTSLDRRVGRWHPAGPAWPWTDTVPQSEIAEIIKPVEAAETEVILRYRVPEYGSGLMVGERWGDSFTDLRAYTCESLVVINARTGAVTEKQVTAEEEPMFARFLEGVEQP